MKRFVISILLALLLTGLCFGLGQAQTFAGLSWEGNPGFVVGGKLVGITDKISTFGYARLTVDSGGYENGLKTQHALAAKLTYHLFDKEQWDFYLIGGTSVDWANPDLTRSLTTYFTQSVGGLFAKRVAFFDQVPLLNEIMEGGGVWFQGEFRPQIGEDSRWQDKVVLGLGLYTGI